MMVRIISRNVIIKDEFLAGFETVRPSFIKERSPVVRQELAVLLRTERLACGMLHA